MWYYRCSDGACIAEEGSKSRVDGHYFLSDFIKYIDKSQPKLNGSIHKLCKILKNIVASASEYELAPAFENSHDATVMLHTLIETENTQPPASMQVDNTKDISFINGTLKEKRTNSVGMEYHWLKDR